MPDTVKNKTIQTEESRIPYAKKKQRKRESKAQTKKSKRIMNMKKGSNDGKRSKLHS